MTPYYNKTTQSGLVHHYEYLADQTDLPIILYNVPSRTGLSFTAETYQILSQHPRINGIKEASGNFSLLVETMAYCGEELNIWSGNDDQTLPMLALGAKGLISVVSNLVPEPMAESYLLRGDVFEIRLAESIPQRQIALVENTTRSPSIAFQRFKKMLLEQPDKL